MCDFPCTWYKFAIESYWKLLKDGDCIRTSACERSYGTYSCLVWASLWLFGYSLKKIDVLAGEFLAPMELYTSATDLPTGKIGMMSGSHVMPRMTSGAGRAGTMAAVLGPLVVTSGALGMAKIG